MGEERDAATPLGVLDDRFELRSQLGRGGMGVVYRAFDRERGVQVALKTLRSVKPDQVLRFKAEFLLLQLAFDSGKQEVARSIHRRLRKLANWIPDSTPELREFRELASRIAV